MQRSNSVCSESSSAAGDVGALDGLQLPQEWEGDKENCSLCQGKLGKLKRHHCRICGLCVCSACSPNQVQLENTRGKQRACAKCIASVQAVPVATRRMAQVGAQLVGMCEQPVPTDTVGTLTEAAALCESALLPLENVLAGAKGEAVRARAEATAQLEARQAAEAEAALAKQHMLQVGARLVGMSEQRVPANGAGTLMEAAALCESALLPLENVLAAARSEAARAGAEAAAQLEARQAAEDEASLAKAFIIKLGERFGTAGGTEALQGRLEDSDVAAVIAAVEEVLNQKPTRGGRSAGSTPDRAARRQTNRSDDQNSACTPNTVDPELLKNVQWEQNTPQCSHCGQRVGKRYLRPRHHCRTCGKCVCAGCSPNLMQVEGQGAPSRVCTPCIASVGMLPELRRRATLIGRRLTAMGRADPEGTPEPATMAEALGFVETALQPVEAMLGIGEAATYPVAEGPQEDTLLTMDAVSAAA